MLTDSLFAVAVAVVAAVVGLLLLLRRFGRVELKTGMEHYWKHIVLYFFKIYCLIVNVLWLRCILDYQYVNVVSVEVILGSRAIGSNRK